MPNEKLECDCKEKSCTNTCTKKHTCHVFWCEKCVDYGAGGASRFANKDGGLGGGGSSCAEPFVPSKNPMEENYLPNVDYFRSINERLRELENTHQPQEEEDWEKELWNLLYDEYGDVGQNGNIKDFIHSLLSSKVQQAYQSGEKAMLEKVLGEIEGMYKNGTGCGCYSFDKALNSLKDRLLINK